MIIIETENNINKLQNYNEEYWWEWIRKKIESTSNNINNGSFDIVKN